MMNDLPLTHESMATIRDAGVKAYQLSVTAHQAKLAECQTQFDEFCATVLDDNAAIITSAYPAEKSPGLQAKPLALFP